jgi:hypothetical protein
MIITSKIYTSAKVIKHNFKENDGNVKSQISFKKNTILICYIANYCDFVSLLYKYDQFLAFEPFSQMGS